MGGGVGELHAAVVAQPDGGLAEERRQGGCASAVQADQPLVASADAPKEPEEIPGALPDVPEEEIVDVGLFPQDVSVLGSGQERQPDAGVGLLEGAGRSPKWSSNPWISVNTV